MPPKVDTVAAVPDFLRNALRVNIEVCFIALNIYERTLTFQNYEDIHATNTIIYSNMAVNDSTPWWENVRLPGKEKHQMFQRNTWRNRMDYYSRPCKLSPRYSIFAPLEV